MNALKTVVVLAVHFQVILLEYIPEECQGIPDAFEKPLQCCLIPAFFTEDDFEDCGYNKLVAHKLHAHAYHQYEESGFYKKKATCDRQLCMLDKYGLRNGTKLNLEAVNSFLDKWVETHENFFYAMGAAKDQCTGPGHEASQNPGNCLANDMIYCISYAIFNDCPVWSDTDNCLALKDHLDYCRPYKYHY